MKERMIYGFHAVQARLRSQPRTVVEILMDDKRQDRRARDLITSAERLGLQVMRVPAGHLNSLCRQGSHQGVIARIKMAIQQVSLDDFLDELDEVPLLLVLDGVTDPHNLGACLRVADAAGVHAVIAPKDRAAGVGATVSKIASGAAESMPYFMVTNLARTLGELKEREIWIVGADERAEQSLYAAALPRAIAWVLGAEGEGMRRLTRENCDQLVSIPMGGSVSSLNVSVACGVCLFESVRRRSLSLEMEATAQIGQ